MVRRERRNRRWAGVLGVAGMAVTAVMVPAESAASAGQSAISGRAASGDLNQVQGEAAPRRGVRPLGRAAEELLAEARRLSPTVRRLLVALDASNLIVYLECQIPRPVRTVRVALAGTGGGVRYLKVEIFGVSSVKASIAWLAHELQHAVEIASAPEVTDDAGVRQLYERIGRPSRSGRDSYETKAAIDVRNQVLAESASVQSPPTVARPPR